MAHGELSTKFYSRWDLFLHGHAGRPTLGRAGAEYRRVAPSFRTARRERPFVVDAIVTLPDHLHAILTLPPNNADFSGRWRRTKGHFSRGLIDAGTRVKRHANGELALWQRRFWEHTIRDEADFSRHVDYIHFNPVKHELASRVRDWPHSSFHRYVREGLLSEDWAGDSTEEVGNFGERSE